MRELWIGLKRSTVFMVLFWYGPGIIFDDLDGYGRMQDPFFYILGIVFQWFLIWLIWDFERGWSKK